MHKKEIFKYCIDSPNSKEDFESPILAFSGWIVAEPNRSISEIDLMSDGGDFRYELKALKRPDVEAVYPGKSCIGFHSAISILDIGAGKYKINFKINGESFYLEIPFMDSISLARTNFINEKK